MRLQPNTPSNPIPFEPSPANGGSSNSDPAGFSSLLRQTRVAAAPPPSAPAMPAPTHQAAAAPKPHAPEESKSSESTSNKAEGDDHTAEASDSADAPDAHAVDHTRAPSKARTRGHAGGGAAADELKSPAGKSAVGADAASAKDGKAHAAHGTSSDPALASWLAGLHPPHGAAPKTDAAGGNATAGNGGAADGAHATPRAGANEAEALGRDLGAARNAAAGAIDFAALAAAPAQAEAHAADALPASTHAIDATGAAGALLAGAAPTPAAAAAAAAAPAAVGIPTPVDSPDFAQALGLQMSVLAKDGVQQAELHLNPADMGPVSVQIVMEGTQARIDFGADVAATRHAIEAGLPELASALRDAGFTLAGGGVSQHSQPRGDGQSGNGSGDGRGRANGHAGRQASAEGVARVATAARRIVRNGGLDLYA